MHTKRTLQNYYLHGFPDLVNEILGGDVKLDVLINEQPNLYFLPGSITSICDVPERTHNEIRNGGKKYLAKPGKHEICGIGFVVRELETIYNEVTAPGKTLEYYRSKLLTIKQIVSAEGVKGCLVENLWGGLHGNNDLSFARIPFTRILVEQASNPDLADCLKTSVKDENNPELKPQTRTRNDSIKTSMNAYVDECEAHDKKPELDECWRFTAERPGIEENHNCNLVYPILGGKKVKEIDRKRFSERFKALLKDR